MKSTASIAAGTLLALATLAGGCTTIKEKRGYMAEAALVDSIQPGLDNKQSVEGTLGRPTITSIYGQDTWYYVSSDTTRKPFGSDEIKEHDVIAVNFDSAGNVMSINRSDEEQIVSLDPDGHATPTLGKKRTFLQDMFGNIGAVNSAGGGGAGGQ